MTTLQLRHVAKITNSNVDKISYPDQLPVYLCNYVDVYKNERITNNLSFMSATATPIEIKKFGLKIGDVLITKDSEDANDIAVPAYVTETAKNLVCGYHLTLLRAIPNRMRGDFLFWSLQVKSVREAFSMAANGVTRFGLTLDGIKSVALSWHGIETQKEIADFLDSETDRIDQLIKKKKIFLLKASKRIESLVDKAISCQHVPRIRFEHVAQRMQRTVNLSEHDELVRLGLYNRGRGIFKKPEADEEGMGDSKFFFVEAGDLILSGQFAWEGAVALATSKEENCVVSHRYPIYRGKKSVNTAYLFGLLRSDFGDFILNEASRGSAGRNRPLNAWRLGKEKIPIPEISLQKKVEQAVEFERKLREKTQNSIAILKEFRASLITEAVTGQLDIKSWKKRGSTDKRLDNIEEAMRT